MKTFLKAIRKTFKWYLIINGLLITFIGMGHMVERKSKHPEETFSENAYNCFDETISTFKRELYL